MAAIEKKVKISVILAPKLVCLQQITTYNEDSVEFAYFLMKTKLTLLGEILSKNTFQNLAKSEKNAEYEGIEQYQRVCERYFENVTQAVNHDKKKKIYLLTLCSHFENNNRASDNVC